MDVLMMIWGIIDFVFLLILVMPNRKNITENADEMWERSIESRERLGERLLNFIHQVCMMMVLGVFVSAIVYHISDDWVSIILKWYQCVFVGGLLPILYSWMQENNFRVKSICNGGLFALLVIFSIVGYVINTGDKELVPKYRIELNVLISILITVFIVSLLNMGKGRKILGTNKLPKKGIRKDLYCRTPGIMLYTSDVELIKCCERYFDEYIYRYKKLKDLRTIEYVNLAGSHRETWYRRSARFVKFFFCISVVIVFIRMIFNISYKQLIVLGLMFLFVILVRIFKCIDIECLYIVGIRYVYDQWGYYLTHKNDKFVGTVQVLELSKYHKYVHSFLDIVAFYRAIAFYDKIEGLRRICVVSNNLGDLFMKYSNYKKERSWTMVIPLWAAALFEFSVTGTIGKSVKTTLLQSFDENARADISIFLQSFWADMERKNLKDGVSDFVQQFEVELLK